MTQSQPYVDRAHVHDRKPEGAQAMPLEGGACLLRLSMHATLEQPLHLPFAGSALRGAFGHAFEALTHYLARPDVYAHVFEHGADEAAGVVGAGGSGYVVSPPLPLESARNALSFQMTLWGEAARYADWVQQAWHMVFLRGIGEQRVKGSLVSVQRQDLRALASQLQGSQSCKRWSLVLTSPVFIKHRQLQPNGQPLTAAQLQWSHWLHALHRRLRIVHAHCPQAVAEPAPFAQWLQWMEGVHVTTHWHDVGYVRHSQRQLRRIPVQGVAGVVTLEGALPTPLLQALLLGQWLHAGSKTALGLGSYCLQPVAAADGLSVLMCEGEFAS